MRRSRRAGARSDREPLWVRTLLGWLRAHGRRFYNFDGLDRFKAKFQPDRWDPVFAVVDRARVSPRTLYAIAGAFSGGSPILLLMRALGRAARAEAGWLLARRR
jgi:phosphatidylglycerol lysyltransferase